MLGTSPQRRSTVLQYLATGVMEHARADSVWYVDDVDHLRQSTISQVFDYICSGDHIAASIRYLRDLANAENGYDPKLLIETEVIGYILPLINASENPSLVDDALHLTIAVAKCDIPPGTPFENARLYDALNEINHTRPTLRLLSFRLLSLLLEQLGLRQVVLEAMFSETFVEDLGALGIFEEYEVGTSDIRRLKTLKYAFRYVRLMTEGMSDEVRECLLPMIPCAPKWLQPEVKLNASVTREVLCLVTALLSNPNTRGCLIDAGLIQLLMNMIHKNSKNSVIVCACFDCVARLCTECGAAPPPFQTEDFLYLVRGVMQDVGGDAMEHIIRTLITFLEFMPCEALWDVELVDDVLWTFDKGTYAQRSLSFDFLLEFMLRASPELNLKMLEKGVLATMCGVMMALDGKRRARFLDACARLIEQDQQMRQALEECDDFRNCVLDMVCDSDEQSSLATRSFCDVYGFPLTT